ncbi:hypothetical protein [Glycomyces tarimensis]
MAERCTSEVWSLNPDGGQTEEAIAAARPLTKKTIESGVEMRSVYLEGACNDEPTRRTLKWVSEQGAHVRANGESP